MALPRSSTQTDGQRASPCTRRALSLRWKSFRRAARPSPSPDSGGAIASSPRTAPEASRLHTSSAATLPQRPASRRCRRWRALSFAEHLRSWPGDNSLSQEKNKGAPASRSTARPSGVRDGPSRKSSPLLCEPSSRTVADVSEMLRSSLPSSASGACVEVPDVVRWSTYGSISSMPISKSADGLLLGLHTRKQPSAEAAMAARPGAAGGDGASLLNGPLRGGLGGDA
mmetsp:Transcript_37437/g.100616  ORF Transcript_37437/g.100616 Transcript_37437/m.100616 type:complete len:227 (-) Transcript_37437:1-681(-)